MKYSMSPVLVSIIVLTYNQEKYIAQTLDSILSQEHSFSYEILVGDDCSSDNTLQILRSFQKKYKDKIKLFLNDSNQGVVNNYFNLMSQCSGKYIMQCAGDDYWLHGKICMQIEFMEKNPEYGMMYTKVYVYDDYRKKIKKKCYGRLQTSYNDLVFDFSIPAPTVVMSSILVKKYIEEIQPQSKSWLMEDFPLCIWFYLNSKIFFLNTVTAVYRKLFESLSNTTDYKRRQEFNLSSLDVINFFLKKYNLLINSHCFENYITNGQIDIAINCKDRLAYLNNLVKLKTGGKIRSKIKRYIFKSQTVFNLYCWYITRK